MTLVLDKSISKAAQNDILDLQNKIGQFKEGKIDEERFKSFRLTRGVYGQRQLGVQMFRIKLPYGKMSAEQLLRIADLSEQYSNGNLHLTTRQNIQLHYIHLEDTPEMWGKLEEKGVTTKEACGNTVRSITGSALAGIDPEEPFNIAPYAHAVFEYFLRNPICQNMGRKIKIAFSSSEKDSAFTYIHDFGFIPVIKEIDGVEVRGFKALVAGGLGAQAFTAHTAFEFLPTDQVIPFIEAGLRIFDRYGEREKRNKARMKFLLDSKKLGLEKFLQLIEEERVANAYKSFPIDITKHDKNIIPDPKTAPEVILDNEEKYRLWLATNVFKQKQEGFYGIRVKLPLGNIHTDKVRKFTQAIEGYVADDIRVTVDQGFVLRFAREENFKYIFQQLDQLQLAEPGAGGIADITACPGTDTCNLAVTNSTELALELEDMIKNEFPGLVKESDIAIKISGCMNSCGQHMIANIGFHGSSIKHNNLVVPSQQVVIGGGVAEDGKGFIADKVIKLPTKRIVSAVRSLLNDYIANANDGEYFNDFYQRLGKKYFYSLLKPLADLTTLAPEDYIDWGHKENFIPEIGTGECAGVVLDVVGTIINDAEERAAFAKEGLQEEKYPASIYNSYSTFVIGAKALLLSIDVACNTQINIIKDFDKHYVATGLIKLDTSFEDLVLQINKNKPTKAFAEGYYQQAADFLSLAKKTREEQVGLDQTQAVKEVISNFYKA